MEDRGSDILHPSSKPVNNWDMTLSSVWLKIVGSCSMKCPSQRTPKYNASKPWPVLCPHKILPVPAQRQRPARDALVHISWQEVRIQPPVNGAVLSKTEIKAWIGTRAATKSGSARMDHRDDGANIPRDAQREVYSFRSPRLSRNKGAEAERMRGGSSENDSLPR